ncbi:MAG TPA: hypothetical protein VD947_01760 [Patescibacteria group bacterium]|nr:hypothetical protein [Patescibacteria group bacterium]
MDEVQTTDQLKKVRDELARKGLQQPTDSYVEEHRSNIIEISAGSWDDEQAREYIEKLDAASHDINSELDTRPSNG